MNVSGGSASDEFDQKANSKASILEAGPWQAFPESSDVIYKSCAERNVVLGVHCTTPAPCTLLLKQGIHSPEEFSSLRSKTSQECVKAGVPISSGCNLSTTEVKNIWE